MSFTYKYPQPSITGDVIVFDRRANKVLLLKRKFNPYKDCWAIVGGFFNSETHSEGIMDESVRAAAIREMEEEVNLVYEDSDRSQDKTKLTDDKRLTFSFLTVQDKPARDSRGRVVTLVYVCTIWDGLEGLDIKAADDAAEVQWFPLQDIVDGKLPLAFDHLDSIQKFAKGVVYV